jgi:hypothetical protein
MRRIVARLSNERKPTIPRMSSIDQPPVSLPEQRTASSPHERSAGAVDGLSIGYRTVRGQIDPKSRVRRLYQVDLWEISIVTFPLLNGARVSTVKQAAPKMSRLREAAEAEWRAMLAGEDIGMPACAEAAAGVKVRGPRRPQNGVVRVASGRAVIR